MAEPQISSTSCSAVRSSNVSWSAGRDADDVEEQPRRQDHGAGALDLGGQRDAQADLHVGGQQLGRGSLER